jgi:hypothetical protein
MNDDGGKEGKIHHGGNPVLTAAALGAAVVPDVAGNLDRLSGAGGKEVPIHYRTQLVLGNLVPKAVALSLPRMVE